MSAEIKLCKCCHKQKPLDQFDFKKDNTLKLTCRACLLISKSRFKLAPQSLSIVTSRIYDYKL